MVNVFDYILFQLCDVDEHNTNLNSKETEEVNMHNFINPDDSYFKAIHGKGSRNLNTGILTRDLLYHFFQVYNG